MGTLVILTLVAPIIAHFLRQRRGVGFVKTDISERWFLADQNRLYFLFFAVVVAVLWPLADAAISALLRRRKIGEFHARLDFRVLGGIIFFLVPKRSRVHIVGDLEEEYRTVIIPSQGRYRAWCWWWRQVFGVAGPYFWKRLRFLLAVEFVRGWRRW